MRNILLAVASIAVFAAIAAPSVAQERVYRDVYVGICAEAARECRMDWGRGKCSTPASHFADQILRLEALFGEAGGGPSCLRLGPVYTTKRASALVQPVRMLVLDRRTRKIVSAGVIDPKGGDGGGGCDVGPGDRGFDGGGC